MKYKLSLTPYSNKLLSFFIKSKCVFTVNQTKKTDQVFNRLIQYIKEGFNLVNKLDIKSSQYDIQDSSEMPVPNKDLSLNDINKTILSHIKTQLFHILKYNVKFIERDITIIFAVKRRVNKNKYDAYVEYILVWLYMATHFAKNFCFDEIVIYIYHTSAAKLIPTTNDILGQKHVNTGVTTTCPRKSEILIYREEEWFKVLIHETMHNFALDFSDMDVSICHSKILNLFPVNSEVNLFEAYTEFWARIMNVFFCAYSNAQNSEDILTNVELFMQIERTYSCFQMNKVLNYMGIQYSDLYLKGKHVQNLRDEKYKEASNVLAYYILTNILIFNYQDFFIWCEQNNSLGSIVQFKKTQPNLSQLCDFIERHYRSRIMGQSTKCCNNLLVHLKQTNSKVYDFITTGLRMTCCEMG